MDKAMNNWNGGNIITPDKMTWNNGKEEISFFERMMLKHRGRVEAREKLFQKKVNTAANVSFFYNSKLISEEMNSFVQKAEVNLGIAGKKIADLNKIIKGEKNNSTKARNDALIEIEKFNNEISRLTDPNRINEKHSEIDNVNYKVQKEIEVFNIKIKNAIDEGEKQVEEYFVGFNSDLRYRRGKIGIYWSAAYEVNQEIGPFPPSEEELLSIYMQRPSFYIEPFDDDDDDNDKG